MRKKIEGDFSRGMLDKKIKVYRETKKLESKAKVKTQSLVVLSTAVAVPVIC